MDSQAFGDTSPTMMTFQSKDPAARLRFVPPDSPPPFEVKSLVLKQMDPRRLDDTERRALGLFSAFFDRWQGNKVRDIEDAKAMLADIGPDGRGYEVRTDVLPNRRFSGDGFLSRSRYFTLCRSPDGDDGGAMERELTAYHEPLTNGVLDVADLTTTAPDERPEVLVSIPGFTASEHEWLRATAPLGEAMQIRFRVNVTEVAFHRLIDLRVPHAAAWFTHNLSRLRWLADDGDEVPAFQRKPPLDRFVDLLPSLAAQTLGGGNGATRIAGQWLRSLGADGLVFPSARSDARVESRNEDVIDFYGWNIVDYREADPPRLQSFDLTSEWIRQVSHEIDEPPAALYADVSLALDGDPSGTSWSWRNIEQANRAVRLLASALHLYTWARGNASRNQQQLLAAMLGSGDRAEVLAEMSEWFIGALLGAEKVRLALLDSVADGLTPDEARLVDLPGTFRRMDKRIEGHEV